MNGYIIFEEQVTAVIDKYKELSFKIEDGIPCVFGSIILVDEYGNIEDTAYSDETVHPIPGQTEQLFL